MSNGILNFTLGLAAGGFASSLHSAEHSVDGFKDKTKDFGKGIMDGVTGALPQLAALFGVFEAGKGAVEGFFGAIERGASLEQLSRRTGESVQSLYQMQQGFKAVGLSADNVGPMVFKLQKALGGLNDMGEDTRSVFARMGLSVESLKGMSAPQQIAAVAGALKGLNASSAASAAGSIFGRENAAEMIQMSRSMGTFTSEMRDSAGQAKQFAQSAELFERTQRALEKIREIGVGFFAGIAAGVAPLLEQGLNVLEKFRDTLTSIGQKIGSTFKTVAGVLVESFKEGGFTDLMKQGFKASVEYLTNMLIGVLGSGDFWSGIWDVAVGSLVTAFAEVLKVMVGLGQVLDAALTTAVQHVLQYIGGTKLGSLLGIGGYKAETFSDNLKDIQKKDSAGMDAVNAISGAGQSQARLGSRELGLAVAAAQENSFGDEQARFNLMVAGLKNRMGNGAAEGTSDDNASPGEGREISKIPMHKTEGTDIEKMGFVMGGVRNPMKRSEDLLQQIVRNTSVQGAFHSVQGAFNAI